MEARSVPNSHYTPYDNFLIEQTHDSEAAWGDHTLKLRKTNFTHVMAFNREDLLTLADSIHAATGVRFVERDEVRQALGNVAAFLQQRSTMRGLDPDGITGCNHEVLTVTDLRILMEAAEGAIQ